jgi:hypothetical protein
MLNHHQLLRGGSAGLLLAFTLSHTGVVRAEAAAAASQDVVFGLEDPASWTASSGVVSTSSVRSQGSAALALRDFSYSELFSPPLATLSRVSSELFVDIRPPATPEWGLIQVFVTSPTLNLYNAWLGQALLGGLAANRFNQVAISVPPDVERALGQPYSDLQIKVVLNVPQASSDWVIDNLRFAGDAAPDCADGSPYTLLISGQEGVDAGHVERMRCTFFAIYPQLVERFNPAAPTTVGMVFTDEPGVAWASGTTTFYNRAFLAGNPLDSDVVVHEIMHIVQGGYTGEAPGWIIEGTADFVRDAYGLHNQDHGWAIPTTWSYGPHYVDGYGDAAAFMKWIDANYREGDLPVADALDDIMRAGQFSSTTFVELTGLDVEALWHEYSGGQSPLPASSGVTVFQDSGFSGREFTLDVGVYDVIDMRARGLNDRVSSLRVPPGLSVTAYSESFSGESAVYTSDIEFVGGLNDTISSIIVE